MSKKNDLLKNTILIGIGRFISQFIAFILIPVYTLLLTPEQYGIIDLVMTYISLLAPLFLLNIDRGLFRYLVENRDNEKASSEIIRGAIKIVSIVLLCLLSIYFLFVALTELPYLELIVLIVISNAYYNLFLQIARGFGNNIEYTKANLISSLTLALIAITLLVGFKLNIIGVLVSVIFSNTVGALYLFLKLRLSKIIRKSNSTQYNQKMLRYSLPLIPSNMSWWAVNVSDRTIISATLGIAANGIYAVSNKYASIFSAIYAIFDMSWTESASLHIDSDDRNKFFSEVHNSSLKLFGSLALTMIATMPLVFSFIVGSEFKNAYLYFPILVLALFFGSIVSQYSVIYIAKKLTSKVFISSVGAAVINISLNLIFIKRFGLYAASISTVTAYLAMGLFRIYDTKKYVLIKYDSRLVTALIILSALVFTTYYMQNLIINIVVALIVYAISFYLNRNVYNTLRAKLNNRIKLRSS